MVPPRCLPNPCLHAALAAGAAPLAPHRAGGGDELEAAVRDLQHVHGVAAAAVPKGHQCAGTGPVALQPPAACPQRPARRRAGQRGAGGCLATRWSGVEVQVSRGQKGGNGGVLSRLGPTQWVPPPGLPVLPWPCWAY